MAAREMAARGMAARESSSSPPLPASPWTPSPLPVPSPHEPDNPSQHGQSNNSRQRERDGDGAAEPDGDGVAKLPLGGDSAARSEGEDGPDDQVRDRDRPDDQARDRDSPDMDDPAMANKAYVLSLAFALPHLDEPQRVDLCFEPTWTPQPRAAICFRNQHHVVVWPATGPDDAQQDTFAHHHSQQQHPCVTIPFEPINIALNAPTAPIDLHPQVRAQPAPATPPPNVGLWWTALILGSLLSIACSVLASQMVTGTRIWASLTEPDPTLEFAGPLIRIVEDMVNITLFAEQELLLGRSNKPGQLRRIGFDAGHKVGWLCSYQRDLPDRPDMQQLCADFKRASTSFEEASRVGDYPTWRLDSVRLLQQIADSLEGWYDELKHNHGDEEGDEIDRTLRRRRDASVANTLLLRDMDEWQNHALDPFRALVEEQDRHLSIMLENGDRIYQGFQYETSKRNFKAQGSFKG